MKQEQVLQALPIHQWHGPFDTAVCRQAMDALESGKVLVLPLPFLVAATEQRLFATAGRHAAGKNISFDPQSGRLGHKGLAEADRAVLTGMMRRYAAATASLLADLLPEYQPHLRQARTSFRPAEIAGRAYSRRHDDRLLHVDAFPSRPLHGARILRVFTNVAPDGVRREWHVGEPFVAFAEHFLPRVKRPWPGHALALSALRLTKGHRSDYDALMLGLHDAAKFDSAYQADCPKAAVAFAPGTTWLCFTDQVLHAALAGHCALEQTFHLPPEAQAHPEQSPLHVLRRLTGHALV